MNSEAKITCSGCGAIKDSFFMHKYSNGRNYCGSCWVKM